MFNVAPARRRIRAIEPDAVLSVLNFEAPGREPFFALDPGVNYGEGTAVVERLRAKSGCEDRILLPGLIKDGAEL